MISAKLEKIELRWIFFLASLHILLNLYLSFVRKSNLFRVILDRIVLFIVAVLNIAMLSLRQFFMNI